MMLEIRDVHKSFGSTEVLRGIDLDVDKGDIIVVMGPSGSGKTTFLRCIELLERADRGTVSFAASGDAPGLRVELPRARGAEIAQLRRRTGFVFLNWNTKPDGTGTQLNAGDLYTMGTDSITLYAVWAAGDVQVNYNENGGTVDPSKPMEPTPGRSNNPVILSQDSSD